MIRRTALALFFLTAALPAAQVSTTNPLGYDPNMVDRLDMFDTAADWVSAEGVRVVIDGDHLTLTDDREKSYPRSGHWISPVQETAFRFTELLPSWNVDAPEGTGIRFAVRTRDWRSGAWSPWLHIGFWGEVTLPPTREVVFDGGAVNVDILNLDARADAYQMRARFESTDLEQGAMPRLRRLAVCHSGSISSARQRAALTEPVTIVGGEWARTLRVPHHGQGILGRPLSGLCCSPASLTMVLQRWGDEHTVLENSMAVYDPESAIFGNWGRNVARAGALGFDAWLTRFRNFEQVKAQIAMGVPIIASVRIGEDEVAGLTYTGGHLIVIRGFTPEGDVVINDPAYRERGEASVWAAEELATVWFEHGGVAYVIRPSSR